MTVIAIDGPGGSGKSTIARALAKRLGLERLDTGAMYRSVALLALAGQVAPDDEDGLSGLARAMSIELGERVILNGNDVTEALRSQDVEEIVSLVAAHPKVREQLVFRQRDWISRHSGGVIEGRDIASVVAPDADVKVYLTATEPERARRRAAQHGSSRTSPERERQLISARDVLDTTRSASPLLVADGATIIDTTDRSVDEVIDEILELC